MNKHARKRYYQDDTIRGIPDESCRIQIKKEYFRSGALPPPQRHTGLDLAKGAFFAGIVARRGRHAEPAKCSPGVGASPHPAAIPGHPGPHRGPQFPGVRFADELHPLDRLVVGFNVVEPGAQRPHSRPNHPGVVGRVAVLQRALRDRYLHAVTHDDRPVHRVGRGEQHPRHMHRHRALRHRERLRPLVEHRIDPHPLDDLRPGDVLPQPQPSEEGGGQGNHGCHPAAHIRPK